LRVSSAVLLVVLLGVGVFAAIVWVATPDPSTTPPTASTTSPSTTQPAPSTTPPTASTTSSPFNGGYVTSFSVGGSVGVGTVGPVPTEVVGSQTINTARTVLENVVVDGCVTINADNVTIRNVAINCNGFHGIQDNASNGTTIENVTIDCLNNPAKGIHFFQASNFTVDSTEITRCDDQFFIDGGLGNSAITNSVFHNQMTATKAHTDGMQIGEFEITTGTLTVSGNWWEYNRTGCCANAVLFATKHSALTINLHHNYIDGDFGAHTLRCVPNATCNIDYNTLNGQPGGRFFQSTQNNGTAHCNRYTTGQLIPNNLYTGITINNTNC